MLLLHLGFILFVVLGGLAALRRPRLAWIHLPILAYGAAIEIVGWVCPLTPLEQRLRAAAGQAGYTGGFIEHYVGGLVYPSAWGAVHVWLGVLLLVSNAVIYVAVWRRWRSRRAP